MRHPWIPAVTAAGLVASLGLAAPALADDAPVPTTWAGWTATGPFGAPTGGTLAATGTRTVILGSSQNDDPALQVRDATGVTRVGVVRTRDSSGVLHLQILGDDHFRMVRYCGVDTGDLTGTETTDGGATWTALAKDVCAPSPAQTLGVRATAVANETIDNQSVATGGLERSDDGGTTWTAVDVPGPPAQPGGDAVPAKRVAGGVSGVTGRGPGNVVAAVMGAVISSTDGGRTFVRRDLPAVPGIADTSKIVPQIVACDPTDGCLVELSVQTGSDVTRATLRFDGTSYGAVLPTPPPATTLALGGGVLSGIDLQSGLVRSGDFGATYQTIAPASGGAGGFVGSHGLLAVQSSSGLRVSSTAGETVAWRALPVPDTAVIQMAGTPDDPWALVKGGSLLRLKDGAWTKVADVGSVSPASLTLGADGPVVVGRRGVLRVVDGAVQVSDSPALAGRALSGVTARGKVAFAWGKTVLVRSADAGRTWTTVRLPESPVTDVQVLGAKTAVALTAHGLLRTSDAGRRFVRGAALPPLEVLDAYGPRRAPSLEFTTDRRGTILVGTAAFRTGDGGATATLVPAPDARAPLFLLPQRDGVQVQDPRVDFVMGDPALLSGQKPSLTLRRAGTVQRKTVGRGRSKSLRRTVTLVGRLKGAPVGSSVQIASVTKGGRYVDVEAAPTTNADGSFRTSITLDRAAAVGVKAFYAGSVTAARTTRSTTSGKLAIK